MILKIISCFLYRILGRWKKNIIIDDLIMLDDRYSLFIIIKSEFNDESSDIKFYFEKYEDFKNSLKNNIVYSSTCVGFYSYFMKYEEIYVDNYNKVYKFTVIKYKLDRKYNELLLSGFKCYMKSVKQIIELKKIITKRVTITVLQVLI